ncbi:MAG: hypothetical protein HKL96_06305 [Phycisphaerales bacterium]|nr:hypothetical protein [Phycisphaerales bacterium]
MTIDYHRVKQSCQNHMASLHVALSLASAVFFLAAALRAGRPALAVPILTIHLAPAHGTRAVSHHFLGVSIEYGTSLRTLMRRAHGRQAAFVHLMKYLGRYNGEPVIRIGGNSEDRSAWNLSQYPNHSKHLRFNITPADADRLAAIAKASGCKLILGLNLGTGTRHMARQWVRHALATIGIGHILAFEVGNEPDEYFRLGGKWRHEKFPLYLKDFNHMVTAIMPLVKSPKLIAGPAFCCGWLRNITLEFIQENHAKIGLVTIHYYPLGAPIKNPKSPHFASIPNLLKNANSQVYASLIAGSAKMGHRFGLPVRYAEINSAWGGGKRGVSNTFASALWCADTLFEIANAGGAGVNFHTGSIYGAFWPGSSDSKGLQPHPLYYGMLLFAKAVQNGGRLVPVKYPHTGNIKIWACLDHSHVMRIVVINKNLSGDIRIALPTTPLSHATVEYLTAPGVAATTEIQFGGITFDHTTDGMPQGHFEPHPLAISDKQWIVPVAHASAALITIKPE